jgi:hypothetical protein
LAGEWAGENGGKTWREKMGGRNGARKFGGKRENNMHYADGAPRHRLDAVTAPLGHGRARVAPCSYADG